MEHIDVILFFVCFLAGFIDSIAGGGGLIQIPGLMLLFPGIPAPSLLATNKVASISGTFMATVKYMRNFKLNKIEIFLFGPLALIFSALGASIVSYLDQSMIRPIVLCALALVLIFTIIPKSEKTKSQALSKAKLAVFAMFAALIALYDGFLGAGTGGFLIFAAVHVLALPYDRSGALAKYLNLMSNIGAIAAFLALAPILWLKAAIMIPANMLGAFVGSHLVIVLGSKLVRYAMIAVTTCLLVKMALT